MFTTTLDALYLVGHIRVSQLVLGRKATTGPIRVKCIEPVTYSCLMCHLLRER